MLLLEIRGREARCLSDRLDQVNDCEPENLVCVVRRAIFSGEVQCGTVDGTNRVNPYRRFH